MANKPADFPVFSHIDKSTIDKMRIPEHFINDLFYSLVYRDISKESLMILAEGFVEEK